MKYIIKFAIVIIVVLPLIFSSCMKSDVDLPDFNQQLTKDIQAIDNYLASKNIVAQQDASGLRYVIHEKNAAGKKPSIDSCVTANYKGMFLASGQSFDDGAAVSFPLNGVIDGWKIGIPLLNEGDSATLYIPSGYAYGYYGYPPEIPSNANLIFNVGIEKVGSIYKSSDRSCN